MQDIDRVLALSAEVQSLREALLRKESELRALLRGTGSAKALARVEAAGPAKAKKKATRPKAVKTSKRPARGRKDSEGASVMDAILTALGSTEESMNVAQIAALAGAKPTSVSTLLQRLVARGQAKKVSKGQYAAA